ncbi:MAG: hypothetical protein OEM06_08285 [Desulfobacteraceae bacterium]|nr:hypothetical protein [Desulfobacteraceae bacterium]MDH3574673.1 hypothetical protein [Desulfobacteraceae bacterium]MDH3723421.1 hypothetical protein [Desulfobacteraceae bacterium]MDH3837859.1 hypothetical protein [Desulfobacteraceae bacterium]MDH3875219.1 hypothetical protein [Desulfobacteraceae bacterium]
MKQLFWSCIIISLLFLAPSCSEKQIKSVLDDISRDTYENNLREQRIENIGDPNYEEPPSYDQYQRERKETLSDPEITQMTKKMEHR